MCPRLKHNHQSLSQHLLSSYSVLSFKTQAENKDGDGEVIGETEALVSDRAPCKLLVYLSVYLLDVKHEKVRKYVSYCLYTLFSKFIEPLLQLKCHLLQKAFCNLPSPVFINQVQCIPTAPCAFFHTS